VRVKGGSGVGVCRGLRAGQLGDAGCGVVSEQMGCCRWVEPPVLFLKVAVRASARPNGCAISFLVNACCLDVVSCQ